MKVKCFGCEAVIEADDPDTVADAFVTHGQESHSWHTPRRRSGLRPQLHRGDDG